MKMINFDHLAYSPILPEVKSAMEAFLGEDIGNPLSRHLFGEKAKKILDESRQSVSELIGADIDEIIFTSSGSESNNMAIKGIAKSQIKKGRHIIASPLEHDSVYHPLKSLEKQGYEISWLKVNAYGKVNPEEVKNLIKTDTILITVMSASNEIGTLEPIKKIAEIAQDKGVIFHTDAVAAAGIIPINVKDLGVDLLSLAGNPFYAPFGSGALYIRKGVRILPLIEGGIQERGLRSGTHNISAIMGMGKAANLAKEKLLERKTYLTTLRDKLIKGILENISDCFLTGHKIERLPNHASFCIKYIEGEAMLMHLNFKGLAGTSGSTCSSEALKVSRVLKAIGIDDVSAQGSVVFSLGIDNDLQDIEFFLREFPPIIQKLRAISPLYQSN
ncbi:MAG: cysteine desulfurase [Armatimonadetes bacterium]|nr:cysteine desulfurase [Armatimonadota bacterium]